MSADNKLDRPHVVVAAGGLAFLARGGQTHERIFEVRWDLLLSIRKAQYFDKLETCLFAEFVVTRGKAWPRESSMICLSGKPRQSFLLS